MSVWRVGFLPAPFEWADWKFAGKSGRFDGRFDDPEGNYRTLYVAETAYTCFVEVLAQFRPHPGLALALAAIGSDEVDDIAYPTMRGLIDGDWAERRAVGHAQMTGAFCPVLSAETVAELRPLFVGLVRERWGRADFDVSVLKDSGLRSVSQAVGREIYDRQNPSFDGLEFSSRHGDELRMWALFERDATTPSSPCLSHMSCRPILHCADDLARAMVLHGLSWR